LYLPAGSTRHPLIVFAHGYDGDPAKFTELFNIGPTRACGRRPLIPDHLHRRQRGTDLRTADYKEQPADLTFVLDHILRSKWASVSTLTGSAGRTSLVAPIWGSRHCCCAIVAPGAIVMDGIKIAFGNGTNVPNRMPLLISSTTTIRHSQTPRPHTSQRHPEVLCHDHGRLPRGAVREHAQSGGRNGQDIEHLFWRASSSTKATRTKIVPAASVPA
jgi:hypothetical protein